MVAKKILADKLAKWEYSDQPEDYLRRFQETIRKQELLKLNGQPD